MYHFQAPTADRVTCRFWLLNPTGCSDRFCKYAHTITGGLSPPSSFACYAYNNGGCQRPQDECLFSHLISGPQTQYLRIRYPQLALRDIPIAEAAAKAGFDCGNWPNLKNLIEAVRKVESPSYPDRWSGPAAWNSPIYPDHYYANQDRQRKGVIQAYKDADVAHRAASVPAFVIPAKQVIENVCKDTRTGGALNPPPMSKRNFENFVDLTQDSQKRLKTGAKSNAQMSSQTRASNYVDLTREGPVIPHPERVPMSRRALGNISNNVPGPPGGGKKLSKGQRKRDRARRKRHMQMIQEKRADEITLQTTAIIARIASRLHATAADVDADRNVLRQRWEVDDDLKDQKVTSDLAELNLCFARTEEAIMDGIGVIEERLIRRR